MAPQMGRPSVVSLWLSPRFRHIIFTRGRTAPPSRGSPRARHFTDKTSVMHPPWHATEGTPKHRGTLCFGLHLRSSHGSANGETLRGLRCDSGCAYVPPHHFHEREDRASLSWLSPRPTLADLLSAGVGDCSATSV